MKGPGILVVVFTAVTAAAQNYAINWSHRRRRRRVA